MKLEVSSIDFLSQESAIKIAGKLEELYKGDFQFKECIRSVFDERELFIPIFAHKTINEQFCLVLSKQFLMGMSESEEDDALKIDYKLFEKVNTSNFKPCRKIHVNPFLMTQRPIGSNVVQKVLDLDVDDFRLRMPYARLEFTEAKRLCSLTQLSLPSEAQWEYSYRGCTETLFPWGRTLPKGKILKECVKNQYECNIFGLREMQWGEWCADEFISSYNNRVTSDKPIEQKNSGMHVVRGGAADAWPWQDRSHWIMLMSAYRAPGVTTGPAMDIEEHFFRLVSQIPSL